MKVSAVPRTQHNTTAGGLYIHARFGLCLSLVEHKYILLSQLAS